MNKQQNHYYRYFLLAGILCLSIASCTNKKEVANTGLPFYNFIESEKPVITPPRPAASGREVTVEWLSANKIIVRHQ